MMGYDAVPENARLEDKASLPSEAPIDMGRLIETALKNRPDYQAAKDRTGGSDLAGVRGQGRTLAQHQPGGNLRRAQRPEPG
ncbi:MAG: hypothetical protein MZV70_55085 [Desulfobacterales bacterium]|nr:hypothetical protein [Desulfobacterales bacterium]